MRGYSSFCIRQCLGFSLSPLASAALVNYKEALQFRCKDDMIKRERERESSNSRSEEKGLCPINPPASSLLSVTHKKAVNGLTTLKLK